MNPFTTQELRGAWLGLPEAYHPFDFLGVALGTYFGWTGLQGLRGRVGGWPTLTLGLGLLMISIHAQRFFYAPQDRAGLIRLLNALKIDVPGLTAPALGEDW